MAGPKRKRLPKVSADKHGSRVLEFEDARSRLLNLATSLGNERLCVDSALGRVLGETLHSPVSVPSFTGSAMDGYALRFEDLPAVAKGFALPVLGESRAGAAGPPLRPGTAQRIFTGAPLPDGADTVIMQEDVRRFRLGIELCCEVRRGQHVRRIGEGVRQGDVVLRRGTRLGPFHLGLLAALDQTTVLVVRSPRVAILCTGDELRFTGSCAQDKRIGTLPDSNGVAIAALARSVGAVTSLLPIGRDDVDALGTLIRDALRDHDVLVTVGGVSVGDYDIVHDALETVGVRREFYKVSIRPGKPLAVGQRHEQVVVGLPGNPVSAQVTATLFLLPLLRALQADNEPVPRFARRRLTRAFAQTPGRRGFYRATVEGEEVTIHDEQGSGSVTSMALANALATFSEDSAGAHAGELVDTLLLIDV